jgi:hypothetical protein
MTEAQQARRTASTSPAGGGGRPVRTGWVGWVYFAGIMMLMLGFFQSIAGLVAIFDDGYYLVGQSGLVVSVDYTAWGVVHLIIGLVALGAGFATIAGRTWGRTIGIILAVVSAVTNMAFIAAYPVWSVVIIAVDVLVIYALAVHGREVAH